MYICILNISGSKIKILCLQRYVILDTHSDRVYFYHCNHPSRAAIKFQRLISDLFPTQNKFGSWGFEEDNDEAEVLKLLNFFL
jgi:hypothetical protein